MAVANNEVMKPQEGELVSEISKAVEILFLSEDSGHLHTQLQGLVSELKVGFSSALYELSQIQHGDSDIREEVGEARRSCERKALRMETLVESLRDELGEMRCQILQLCGSNRQRSPIQQEVKVTQSALATQRDSDTGLVVNGRSHCECSASSSTSSSSNRGRVLLHCYLQGLKAGMYEGTDARHQVTMQLLHSEWEYVSTLNQLYDKYRTPPALQMDLEPYQNYLKFVEELLQRHLLFRNTLEQRLSAHDWKGLVGDIFVQLVGHNDSSFLDIYHGYTAALATFLSIEFNRIMLNGTIQSTQSYTKEREEVQLFSLLLAPVSRIHSYLTLIQSLLQWTDSDHPDCSLLQGSERVLRNILSRCHLILEDDVRWGDGGRMAGPSGSCSACPCAKSCDHRSQLCPATDTQKHRQESAGKREEQQPRLSNCAAGCQSMPVARWSTGTVRKKSCYRDRTGGTFQSHLHDSCGLAGLVYGGDISAFLHTAPPGWGDSDSGQESPSQATGVKVHGHGPQTPGPHMVQRSTDDCDTEEDVGDTSVFDYSSVTTCSPDGTLRREGEASNTEEEDEEEDTDSQVPVLLKPSYTQQQQLLRDSPRERTVCLRWQIPRLPYPSSRSPRHQAGPAGLEGQGQTSGPAGPYGNRVINITKGPPPLIPTSVFRPIWDEPPKQEDAAPVKENTPQGFRPVQATERQTFPNFKKLRFETQPRVGHVKAGAMGGVAVWDESEEDSEGPCSTV
ncbi:uncharacterized protein LOC112247676 isoform X1 [Oncorhynchus tshawytscha]|uniref:uncharacterized protein LOC112247676 isoform X1 n=1 Tax=Oncorhynchus tshawytscha TaxID=74940 RepID=UPI001C3DED44|nr:uncharacterized protein LOC112247676 isoform X1 [Oncorhynchus tshawytscha]